MIVAFLIDKVIADHRAFSPMDLSVLKTPVPLEPSDVLEVTDYGMAGVRDAG